MERERDILNESSTSKAGPIGDEESNSSEYALEPEILPTNIVILADKRVFHNEPNPSETLQREENDAKDKQKTSTPIYFFESDQQITLPDPEHPAKHPTPSSSTSQGGEQPGGSNEPGDDGGHGTTDHREQDSPSNPKALEQRIDSRKVESVLVEYEAIRTSTVETSLADIFFEMTGAGFDSHDNDADTCDEMSTSRQGKNYFSYVPFCSGILDLFENRPETEVTTEDAVEDEQDSKVGAPSSSQHSGTAAEVPDEPLSSQPGPSSAKDDKVEYQRPRDPREEMYEFMNTISNPSPFIQKQKLEYEKAKKNEFPEKVAMKIMEKMVMSSMNTFTTEPKGSQSTLNPEKLNYLTKRVDELEKRLKQIDREKRESEREKKHLLEQVSELEHRALELKKQKLMKEIMSTEEPSERDLELLAQLKDLMKYQEESTKELREIERQNRIMERLLSQAECTLFSSPWFRYDVPKVPVPGASASSVSPRVGRKKIRFNQVGIVATFDQRDAPSKVPHWTSEFVETISIETGDEGVMVHHRHPSFEDQLFIEEEIRKKKQEEKFVKASPLIEEDEDLENEGSKKEEGDLENEGSKKEEGYLENEGSKKEEEDLENEGSKKEEEDLEYEESKESDMEDPSLSSEGGQGGSNSRN